MQTIRFDNGEWEVSASRVVLRVRDREHRDYIGAVVRSSIVVGAKLTVQRISIDGKQPEETLATPITEIINGNEEEGQEARVQKRTQKIRARGRRKTHG